jgi:spermidine synthase
LYKGKSKFQKIELIQNKAFGRVLLLDGLVQTTDADEFFYHEMLVHPALPLHRAAREVLIIGGGDGGALREVLRHKVRKARLCEIDGQVIDVCRKYYPWLRRDFADPRAELIVADGNEFISSTKKRFDVILVDSSGPVGPSTVLPSTPG